MDPKVSVTPRVYVTPHYPSQHWPSLGAQDCVGFETHLVLNVEGVPNTREGVDAGHALQARLIEVGKAAMLAALAEERAKV